MLPDKLNTVLLQGATGLYTSEFLYLQQVHTFHCSERSHNVLIHLLCTGEHFHFKWNRITVNGCHVLSVVRHIPLTGGAVKRMGRRTQPQVVFALPVGTIVPASFAG